MPRTKPLHIALFIPSLVGGGAERVTINLARGLIAAGVKTDIVVGQAQGPYLKDIPNEARLIDLKATRTLTALWPFSRYLRKERPDGLISALDHANVVALLAKAISRTKMPVVVATHIHLSTSSKRQPFWRAQLDRCLQRLTYPRALAVVAVSHGVAEDMARRFGWLVSDIRVIYNPVIDQDLLARAQHPPSHKWLTDTRRPVIVALGRLTAQKNFSLLLHAIARLKKQSPVKLIILGEGEEREKLQQLVSELQLQDTVDMPGFVGNPYSYMRRASVVALSSRWEALPTVLIEALACGVPVVATDCPAGPSEVLANGKYGKLVPMGDPTAMASALLDALKKPSSPPAESWQPYLIEEATRKYLSLFQAAAHNR
jgi:glycosyltransferase involved in cell wall biosynthesis